MLSDLHKQFIEPFSGKNNMNLGCGHDYIDGWTNVDLYAENADIQYDATGSWPELDDQYDCVLASHFLEHFDGMELVKIFWEAGRVLRPGGHFIGISPYGSSKHHWSNPFHKQPWFDTTPRFFDKKTYERDHTHQKNTLHDWNIVTIQYMMDRQRTAEEIDKYWNQVAELWFVMKINK